ncbi:hypothetical protein G3485_20300 [Shewanella baltica]|uniref:Uncharacterized protein n=1 Tax=Shewanella baltica (strain OS195) TaxID=399599 RepID=A9KXG1_SHEB9|nr:hypothetical protein [Shewanella baltica]ABX48900.1 conserved hypothetical protein [Shewanella baltica OS195]ADT93933.1 hypothetical protein Sbal678_1765 [Shewanella baltica OS678]MCS6129397.1 hypothetical protein [Shewanella baltica]MCS6141380.1 hypothetical protein [Shewanella baltica]MCS6147665.1 hypothetical protein [Shewanella baltica]
MWQGAILNFLSILKYSLILFVIQTAVSTASTMLNDVDNLASRSPSNLLMYHYIPTILVSLLVLSFYAKTQRNWILLHLLAVFSLSELFGFAVVSILMGEFYVSPTWFIDLPIAALVIGLSAIIGSKVMALTKLPHNKSSNTDAASRTGS